ncbi:MAG: hypothetical protein ABIZ18_01220 [Caldimonas sp.]
MGGCATSASPWPAGSVAALAPTGQLRACINYGNPVLARRDAAGQPMGVSVDLARKLAAGVRQQLVADAKRLGGLRLLPGHFMVIEQAMGLPTARGAAAADALAAFVERAKASGFVASALVRSGIEDALVAPPAG